MVMMSKDNAQSGDTRPVHLRVVSPKTCRTFGRRFSDDFKQAFGSAQKDLLIHQ